MWCPLCWNKCTSDDKMPCCALTICQNCRTNKLASYSQKGCPGCYDLDRSTFSTDTCYAAAQVKNITYLKAMLPQHWAEVSSRALQLHLDEVVLYAIENDMLSQQQLDRAFEQAIYYSSRGVLDALEDAGAEIAENMFRGDTDDAAAVNEWLDGHLGIFSDDSCRLASEHHHSAYLISVINIDPFVVVRYNAMEHCVHDVVLYALKKNLLNKKEIQQCYDAAVDFSCTELLDPLLAAGAVGKMSWNGESW